MSWGNAICGSPKSISRPTSRLIDARDYGIVFDADTLIPQLILDRPNEDEFEEVFLRLLSCCFSDLLSSTVPHEQSRLNRTKIFRRWQIEQFLHVTGPMDKEVCVDSHVVQCVDA